MLDSEAAASEEITGQMPNIVPKNITLLSESYSVGFNMNQQGYSQSGFNICYRYYSCYLIKSGPYSWVEGYHQISLCVRQHPFEGTDEGNE